MDFVVLNMELTKETPLILGRPFLSTAKAQIDVGIGEICFNINGQEGKFEFRPRRQESCNMIRIRYGPNPQGITEVEIQPQLLKNLSKISKQKPEPKQKMAPKKNKKEQKKKELPKRKSKKRGTKSPNPHKRRQCGRQKKKWNKPPHYTR